MIPSSRSGSWLATLSGHAMIAGWTFWGALVEGRVLFFRDIFLYYFPNYVFVAGALRQGVWPLWNHTSDLGAPFLLAEPLDLLLLATSGATLALRLLPPLYLWIGMTGTTLLARRLGQAPLSAWTSGALYGVSGLVLSSVNLFEYFHAVAWAPLVIAAFLALWESPAPRGVAILALPAAALGTTLSIELVLQAGAVGLFLLHRRPDARRVGAALAAGALAAAMAAPALLGSRALLADTARAEGFPHDVSFAWSVSPMVLASATLPSFLGDPHTWGETGFWGQPFFETGQPYLLSLYLGPIALGLALAAGRGGGRLWVLVAAGVLLGMGDRGPLGALMAPWMGSMRAPVKFLWTANLALCLLAGRGLAALIARPSRRLAGGLGVAAAALGAMALACAWNSEEVRLLLIDVIPHVAHLRAATVLRDVWPAAFGLTAALAGAAALAAARGRTLAPLVALLALLDLLGTHEGINATADQQFYELRQPLADEVARARAEGTFRWFSYGLAHSPGVAAVPAVATLNSDALLYYVDRQSLVPRTPALDGLEAAFDLDRAGWAPPGSTLSADEKDPRRFAEHYSLLRLANVRWVLSFHELPAPLLRQRRAIPVPEVESDLRLYELRAPLPRAFWVAAAVEAEDPAALRRRRDGGGAPPRSAVVLEEVPPRDGVGRGRRGGVRYERLDPHTVRLVMRGDPGWVVVLDNHHPDWEATGPEGTERLYRAFGGYQALWTPGGAREVRLRYRPAWVVASLGSSATAGLLSLALLGVPPRRERPSRP